VNSLRRPALFDPFIDGYESELALFEETAFGQLCELEEDGGTEVEPVSLQTGDLKENESVVSLDSNSFTPLDDPSFCRLRI
jgi:hypothetical protein